MIALAVRLKGAGGHLGCALCAAPRKRLQCSHFPSHGLHTTLSRAELVSRT